MIYFIKVLIIDIIGKSTKFSNLWNKINVLMFCYFLWSKSYLSCCWLHILLDFWSFFGRPDGVSDVYLVCSKKSSDKVRALESCCHHVIHLAVISLKIYIKKYLLFSFRNFWQKASPLIKWSIFSMTLTSVQETNASNALIFFWFLKTYAKATG